MFVSFGNPSQHTSYLLTYLLTYYHQVVFVSFGLLPMVHWAWVTPAEHRLRYHGLLLLMFALCACQP